MSSITNETKGQGWLLNTINILDILSCPESTIRPAMAGRSEKFSNIKLSDSFRILF